MASWKPARRPTRPTSTSSGRPKSATSRKCTNLLVNDHCAAFITRVRHLPGPPDANGVIHLTFADARSIAEALLTKAGYGN